MVLVGLEATGTLWAQLVLFLTTVSGFAYMWFRDNRKRRWDQEDRKHQRQEEREAREALARLTVNQVEQVKHVVEAKGEEVKVEANKAYTVANSVNDKIDRTNNRLDKTTEQFDKLLIAALAARGLDTAAADQLLEEVKDLSADTNVVAHEIHEVVKDKDV